MDVHRSIKHLRLAIIILIFSLTFSFSDGQAADVGSQLAEQFLKKIPVTEVDSSMTMEQGLKAQERFLEVIGQEFGSPVGYKAGLTNPNVQKAFGVSQPVRGTLLSKMLLKSGSVVPADFGAASFSEGDLILKVGSEEVNFAKTQEEALRSMEAVIPFIELPDMVFAKGVKLTGPAIVAINVGARYGVLGTPIPVKATPEWIDRLKNFALQVYDEKGAMVAEGTGAALLGHPLNVVLWIKDSLAAEGKKLKKGDLLSLGTVTRMMPAKPGTTVKARYIGLDPAGPVEISVSFK
jgi:2-keto-4-pentenoate hydratase